jgi:two-component system response regulator HydG
MKGKVLLVDDDRSLCETLELGLRKRDFDVAWRTSADEAIAAVQAEDLDVVVTDLNMQGPALTGPDSRPKGRPDAGGLELCERVTAIRRDLPVVVLTAFGNFESAVAAIRAGAYDFINKPVQLDVLAIALDRAIQHRALREEVKRLRLEAGRGPRIVELVGDSPAMQGVFELIERVAPSETSVLVTGESGTGKEVVARALHRRSRRSSGPFVAINCAAMPEALLESELFGHARGAFTDAKTAHPGLLVQARGGTVFLDEIGDMPLALQPKLLRVLQERVLRPVGSTAEVPIDVRFVTATNRDLETAVEEHRFREDLYFRINVIQLALPPLRARGADILVLAQHFVVHFAARNQKNVTGISPAAASCLLAYAWPGNVRELQNCIERAVTLARFEEIGVGDLPDRIRTYKSSHVLVTADDPSELVPMEEVERRYILRVLEAMGGNKTAAARTLGFERKTLYRKLEHFGIDTKKGD